MRGRKCNAGGSVSTGPSRGAVDASDLSTHKPKTSGPVDYVEGAPSRRRYDRPGRKLGGRAGSDLAPLSTASKTIAPAEKG